MKSLISGIVEVVRGQSPIPYTSTRLQAPLFGGTTNSTQYLKAMGTVGTLFSIVNRTSTSVAKVEWCLYRKAANGDPEKRIKVTSHWALDLWNEPNPFMSRPEFVEVVQQHIDLTGEMWWVISRDTRAPSIPAGIWPVRPDRMRPVPHPTRFISHYQYTGPDGERIDLRPEDVIFIKMPNPDDPFRGMGPVQSVLADLDSIKYSAEWNRRFFLNGAEPGGIIEVDRHLSDPEFDEMQLRWQDQHQGIANAHRVAILETAKWVERKYTNRDMQFVELRSVGREVIREAFGMPKFAVGDVDDINRATADASAAWFGDQITAPRCDRIKGALNHRFLKLFGPGSDQLEFDFEAPSTDDYEQKNAVRDSQVAAWIALVNAGVDPADASTFVGIPQLKYEKPAPPPPPVPPATDPEEGDAGAAAAVARALRILARVGDVDPKGPVAQLDDETDATLQRAADRMASDWDDALDRLLAAWDTITAIQRDELCDQVQAAVEADNVEALASLEVTTTGAVALLHDSMEAMAEQGADQIVQAAREQDIDIDWDPSASHPPAIRAASKFGDLLSRASATARVLAGGLCDSVAREVLRLWGSSPDASEIARQIREFINGLSDRALRDQLGGALTNAMNKGRFTAMLTGPTAVWYASERNDRSACGPCRDVNERKFDSLEAADLAYPSGGYIKCEGGVRCRGGIVPVWEV